MAENAVVGSTTAPGSKSDTNRGLPYYEKLRGDLRETLHKKRMLDRNMALLEEQIYKYESSYLEDTMAGNIIKGFDNYIKGSGASAGTAVAGGRKKTAVNDRDRVFSRSSASYSRDSPAPTPSSATPSHAPTPSSSSAVKDVHQGAGTGNKPSKKTKKAQAAASADELAEEESGRKRIKVNFHGRGDG